MRSSFVALVIAATTASTLALPAPVAPIVSEPGVESSSVSAFASAPSGLHTGHGPVVLPSGSGSGKGPRPSGHAGKHPKLWDDKFCTMTGEHKPKKSGKPEGGASESIPLPRAVPTESGEAEPTGLSSGKGAHPSGKPHHPKLWNDKFCTMTHEGKPKETGSHVIHHQQEPTGSVPSDPIPTDSTPTDSAPSDTLPTAASALKRAMPIESGAPLSGAPEPTGAASAKGPHHSGAPKHSKKPWDPEHCTMSGEHKPKESGHAHSHGSGPKASGSKRAEPIEPIESGVAPSGVMSSGAHPSGKPKHPEHWDDKFCKVKGKGKGKGKGHKSGAAGPEESGEASASLGGPSPVVTPPPDASGSASLPSESGSGSGSALSDASGAAPSSSPDLD